MIMMRTKLVLLLLGNSIIMVARACTDILVTPGASKNGSAIIAYNADCTYCLACLLVCYLGLLLRRKKAQSVLFE